MNSNMKIKVCHGDNLEIMKDFPDDWYNLIYTDPPFNTKKKQQRKRTNKGKADEKLSKIGYSDNFDNYIEWLEPRVIEAHRILKTNGSILIHLDFREVHYVKVMCDKIFGRDCFMNEIVWSYDFGARSKKKWSAKHDSILWYVKNKKDYVFNYNEVDRVPYKAPELIRRTAKNAEKKIALGKTITDVWTDNIVHTMSKERTGYPTQKPMTIVERIVKVHSNPGDNLLDFFGGSGTLGEAAAKNGRNVTLIDQNSEAINIIKKRLCRYGTLQIENNQTIS